VHLSPTVRVGAVSTFKRSTASATTKNGTTSEFKSADSEGSFSSFILLFFNYVRQKRKILSSNHFLSL